MPGCEQVLSEFSQTELEIYRFSKIKKNRYVFGNVYKLSKEIR